MRARTFQSKLLLLVIAVLLLLEAATLASVHLAGQTALRRSIGEELRVGARVLSEVLANRATQLQGSLRVLALDFPFREAVAAADIPTVTDVLANHGNRIGADALVLVGLDGSVVAGTLGAANREVPVAPLLAIAREGDDEFATLTLRGRPYQFVVVPVLAPRPIAWLCAGFEIDRTLVAEIADLTAFDVSVRSAGRGGEALLVSTLDPPAEDLARLTADGGGALSTIDAGGESYMTLAQPIATDDGSRVNAFLHRSMAQASAPFARLELQIAIFSLVALGAAIAAAIVFSRSVSRPLQTLAEAAGRIEQGDYATEIVLDQEDEIGQLATAFNEMQSAIAAREEQIRYQATHDVLTSLPNRTLFLERISKVMGLAQRDGSLVAMMIMDVDRFKEVNDTLGHQFGDQLIIEIGRRLERIVGSSDPVARLGGDEFAIRFTARSREGVDEIARRLTSAFDAPFVLGDVSVDVDVSAGIALFPEHATTAEELMRRADVAMYDAKRSHERVAVYEAGRDEHSLRRLSLMTELRQAIARDELTVHYQPNVDVATGQALRAEALVRWNHGKHGVMRPDEFIPLAEQSGNVGLITRWVLRQAIRQMAAWRREGLDVAVSVNLSAVDLFDAELGTYVRGLLADEGVSPDRLTLEITESAIMKDPAHAGKILRGLKAGGVTLAIDDFGTGYSSLAQLKRLPVDELKIDKSFVLNLTEESTNDLVIVRSTIELAHNMGLKVVAEGVETQAGYEILRRLGCDMAQGFWMAKPMAGSEVGGWMAGWVIQQSTVNSRHSSVSEA